MLSPNIPRQRDGGGLLMVAAAAVMVVVVTNFAEVVATPIYSPCIKPMEAECAETQSNLSDKIIGGHIAEPGSTPWLVSLQDTHYQFPVPFCGGTLISHNWVLTSATCVFSYLDNYDNLEVVVGEYDMAEMDGYERFRRVNLISLHPNYDQYTRHADVALLRLAFFVFYSERIDVLQLPVWCYRSGEEKQEEGEVKFLPGHGSSQGTGGPEEDDLYTIAGWGRQGESGEPSLVVRTAKIPLVSLEECRKVYPEFTSTMICAGNLTHGGLDSCQGDMGGPLATSDGYIMGVASWSVGCGRPGYPGVYTDVAQVVDWICSVTNKDIQDYLPSCRH